MKIILITLIIFLAGCGGTAVPSGNSALFCVSVEAAALLQFISSTTLFEGVVGPTDSNGEPMMTPDQLTEAMRTCFADPQSEVLLEALRQVNAAQEGG